ncbi:hypothetical protein MKW94_020979 [Papaver nudicaule]|uniref:FHA domain-containing protein n=1 Tax=Papaver nudicaule TaxID=74823 RepID=A0AA41SAT4_PAPNU|nr:hypothetical protein [Papaver nudicaule]
MATATGSDVEAGFAKLQGEDFEYYMQTYSIILGRNSKKSTVDVDLSSLGGGMNISRHHARIFYDFQRRRFALEVIGKNGCFVEGVLHLPGDDPPIKLDSQDLLQIGDKKFYFLLPVRSILGSTAILPPPRHMGGGRIGAVPVPPVYAASRGRIAGPSEYDDDDEEEDEEGYEEEAYGGGSASKKLRAGEMQEFGYGAGKGGSSGQLDKRSDPRSRASREADNNELLKLEEKEVVSCVATVLSDLCDPGEWMAMATLHTELVDRYGNVWHHGRVRRYLTSEEWPKGKPWYGLLALLRKYPEHFVINIKSKGTKCAEFVSLVSLIS